MDEILKDFRESTPEFLSLDTEFERRTTYFPKLALVQLKFNGKAYLIDPLAVDVSPLKEILTHPSVTKIIHSAKQDIEILRLYLGVSPAPLFDTQLAAALCGFRESMGYDALVYGFTNVALSKSQQNTLWLKRPLSSNQKTYALKDVEYLETICRALNEVLINEGRKDWLLEIQNRFYGPHHFEVNLETGWLRFPYKKMAWEYVSLVIDLATWREQKSIAKDTHRTLIVPDKIIENLCAKPVRDYDCYIKVVMSHPYLWDDQQLMNELYDEYVKAQERLKEEGRNLFVRESIKKLMPPVFNANQLKVLNHLKKYAGEMAQTLKIPKHYLVEKKEIENFILNPEGPHGMEGTWRWDIVGAEFEKYRL